MSKLKSVFPVLVLLALLVGAYAFVGRRAPVPAAFDNGLTLASAIERSTESGKPVLALATADWCPGCQVFKRGALAQAHVNDLIEREFIPVYVDVDRSGADAQRLGVSSIPSTVVLVGGREKDRVVGALGADALVDWLSTHAASGDERLSPAD